MMDGLGRRTAIFVLLLLASSDRFSNQVALITVPRTVDLKTLSELGEELMKGDRLLCHVTLNAHEYLYVEVEQLGTDVKIAVFAPPEGHTENTDHALLEVDSPTGAQGLETLRFFAPRTGRYTLVLSALDDGGPESRIRVRRADSGTAGRDERKRAGAQRDLWQAEVLAKEKASSIRERRGLVDRVAKLLRRAAARWSEVGAQEDEARALLRLGQLYERHLSAVNRESLSQVIEEMRQARDLAREIDDPVLEARILRRLARLLRHEGRFVEARECYEAALACWRRTGKLKEQAIALNDLGNHLFRRLGSTHPALESFQEALRLWHRSGRRHKSEGITRYNLGNLYAHRGELSKAYDQFLIAGHFFDPEHDGANHADALTRRADMALDLLGPEKALELYHQALKLLRTTGDRAGEARALNGMGLVHLRTQRPQEALDALRHALGLSHDHGDALQYNTVLNNLCLVHERMRDHPAAIECYQQILGAAGSRLQRLEVQALFGLARIERFDGRLERALDLISRAIDKVETIRIQARRPDLRSSFLAQLRPYFEFHIDLLVELSERTASAQYREQAFEALEASRTRSLLDLLGEVRTGVENDKARLALERLAAMRERINNEHLRSLERSADPEQGTTAAQSQTTLEELLESYRQQEARWRLENPRYASLVLPWLVSLEEVQQEVLDTETLLLAFALGEERSFVWAISREAVELRQLAARHEIEWTAQRLAAKVAEYRGGSFGKASLESSAAGLSRMILGPVAHLLDDYRRLLVVVPGSLQNPPLSLLPDPRDLDADPTSPPRPLVSEHQVLYVPSVSVLVALRNDVARRAPPVGRVAVIADPVFDPDDERLASVKLDANVSNALTSLGRLHDTQREADAIRRFAGDDGLLELLGFEARRELVTSGVLEEYRIVHFATHGHLDAETPELSALVLSRFDPTGRSIDGYLRLYDLFHLRFPADLIVLSACESALGREIRGEGLWGLTSGFMHAGAKSLLVSLWSVDDEATAVLMERFYLGLFRDGEPPAEALRQAQNALRNRPRWRAPFFWAGFVLQGDWK